MICGVIRFPPPLPVQFPMTSDRIQKLTKNDRSGDSGIQTHSRTIGFEPINPYVGEIPDPVSIFRKSTITSTRSGRPIQCRTVV